MNSPLVKKCVLTQHVVTASKTFVRTEVETHFLTKGKVSYPKEGQFLFSNLDNFAKWEIKILIFAAIIDTY
jgi:hypothetical protein